MNPDINRILEILEGLTPDATESGEVIPRHKVKGDPKLYHFDHYESTILRITPNNITLIDYYLKTDSNSYTDPIFEVCIKGRDNIAQLIKYFNIQLDNPEQILKSLYNAMTSYAKEQSMNNLDLFGKLFKDIKVEFETECLM